MISKPAMSVERPSWWYRPLFYVGLLLVIGVVYGALQQMAPTHHRESSVALAERLAALEARLSREHVAAVLQARPLLGVLLGALALTALVGVLIGVVATLRGLWRRDGLRAWLAASRARRASVWSLGDIARLVVLTSGWIVLFPFVETGYRWLLRWPLHDGAPVSMLLSSTYLSTLLLLTVAWLAHIKRQRVRAALGLSAAPAAAWWRRAIWGYVTLSPTLVGLLLGSAWLAERVGYQPPPHPLSLFFLEEPRSAWLLYGAAFACLIAPLVEETIFRGVIFPAIRSRAPFWVAAGVSGLLFGALHANWVSFLPIASLGVLLAYLYESTGSLYASIAVHALHNGVMVTLMFIYRALLQG